MLLRIALALGLCFATLAHVGCQKHNKVTSYNQQTGGMVVGFGQSETRTSAGKAAWNDAFDRIRQTGVDHFRVIRYKTDTHQSQGLWHRAVQVVYEPLDSAASTAAADEKPAYEANAD